MQQWRSIGSARADRPGTASGGETPSNLRVHFINIQHEMWRQQQRQALQMQHLNVSLATLSPPGEHSPDDRIETVT